MQEVYPHAAELHMLLGDPKAVMQKWFPAESSGTRPEALTGIRKTGLMWTNHCFGVHVMVMELHALATGKPLLPLVLGIIPKSKTKIPSSNDIVT